MIGRKGATRNARVTRYREDGVHRRRDVLAVEEPLEIRLTWTDGATRRTESLAVTMRTPGNDFELTAGFLHGEGMLSRASDLLELTYCTGPEEQEYNVVEARLSPGRAVDWEHLRRNFYTSSSCGVCGKASLEAVQAQGCALLPEGPFVREELVASLPDRLLQGQDVFARTGGLHAAGMFDGEGGRLTVMEDVGRHNAVDKVVGHALLGRWLPANDHVLVVSGRASFELVQKSIAAGIPILVAVGAPSSLAVELAGRFRQTLVGFARDGGFNVYATPERIG